MYCAYSDFFDKGSIYSKANIATIIGIDSEGEELKQAVTVAINAASGEIDREIGNRYQIPVPSTAPQSLLILKNLCVVLTVAWIYEMNGREIPKPLATAIDNTRQTLTAYAIGYSIKGRVSVAIGLPDAPLQTGPVIISPLAISPSPENIAMNFHGKTTTEQAGP